MYPPDCSEIEVKLIFIRLSKTGHILSCRHSMPIHVLQYVFHIEKLFCTHRLFHKYEQTRTEKFAQALLLILMREVSYKDRRCCLNIVAKYRKRKSDFGSKFRNRTYSYLTDCTECTHSDVKPAPRRNGNKLFIYVVQSQMTACFTTWLKRRHHIEMA